MIPYSDLLAAEFLDRISQGYQKDQVIQMRLVLTGELKAMYEKIAPYLITKNGLDYFLKPGTPKEIQTLRKEYLAILYEKRKQHFLYGL